MKTNAFGDQFRLEGPFPPRRAELPAPHRLRRILLQSVIPMAEILPFLALRYDPARAPLPQVLTQPYDKISPQMQERYYSASPYNLVRIILGRRDPGDNTEHNVYTRAAERFRDWRSKGILCSDALPSIYGYSEGFTAPGGSEFRERMSFIALGRVEDYATKVVFRHEQTLSKPKADRLDLLRATRAHFELLFMLYEDSGGIDAALASATTARPTIEVTDEYGVLHRVWPLSQSRIIDSIRTQMRDQKLVIADGHHRYETALNYRDERRSAAALGGNSGAKSSDEPYEFAVMAFVNMNSPGLLILPTHRVVHGLTSFSAEDFIESAAAYFDVEEVDPALDARRASAVLRDSGHARTALLAATANRFFLLRSPEKFKPAAAKILSGLSVRQQSLDVVQLHKCLLEGVFKLSEESIRNQQNISYVREADEAIAQVRDGKANVSFLMNPCRIEQVRDVAFSGEVMPQKSTDFYPKLLSGLTIYALD
jgi:uncharacterized protein (DUF1015 family)